MSDAPISPEAIARVGVALAAARPVPADDFPCCSPGSTAHEPTMIECTRCRGRGGDYSGPCSDCYGTGEIPA